MLLPALSQARERARAATCISNLKQVGVALEMYANDYSGIIALVDENGKTTPAGQWQGMWREWSVFLMMGNYIPLQQRRVFYCPSRRPDPSGTKGSVIPTTNPELKTYGIGLDVPQSWCMGKYVLDDSLEPWSIYLKKDRIPKPSSYVMVADTGAVGSITTYGALGEAMYFVRDWNNYGQETAIFTLHTGVANILFADWHVEAVNTSKLPSYGVNHYVNASGSYIKL
ncbi:MAG: DUF1559 domain-containing protein [bacterium]|nr:DUF1559 domain-containing protein [bacterium]